MGRREDREKILNGLGTLEVDHRERLVDWVEVEKEIRKERTMGKERIIGMDQMEIVEVELVIGNQRKEGVIMELEEEQAHTEVVFWELYLFSVQDERWGQ